MTQKPIDEPCLSCEGPTQRLWTWNHNGVTTRKHMCPACGLQFKVAYGGKPYQYTKKTKRIFTELREQWQQDIMRGAIT